MEEKIFEAIVGTDADRDIVELTLWHQSATLKKTVAYDQFCEMLLENRQRRETVKLGLFPKEVLSVLVGEQEKTIFCFLPADIHFLGYKRQKEELNGYMVPYPGMIMAISWQAQRACPVAVWCVNRTVEWPDEDTVLYRFPFGNVSDTGSICMGGNFVRLTGNESLTEVVKKCEELFYNTPYNGDYYQIGNKVASMESLGDLLKSLHGKRQFPDELLISDGRTVQDLELQ